MEQNIKVNNRLNVGKYLKFQNLAKDFYQKACFFHQRGKILYQSAYITRILLTL